MNFSSWALAPEALGAGWGTPGVPFTDVEAGASPGPQEALPEESFWAPLLAPSWSPPGVLPWNGMECYGMLWNAMECYGMLWHGMAWNGGE